MASRTRTDVVRAAYAAHFGPLFDSDASYHGFQVLRFWARRPPMVYASLGARPAEVTISSVVPFPEFKDAIADLAGGGKVRMLSPLTLVPYRIERTPFEGLLIVPPEDGTLAVPVPGKGAVSVYRAVPVTGSELGLGQDAPERLLHLLRGAGALVADPVRECVLEPELTRAFWKRERPSLIAHERRRLRASRARLSFFHESGAPPMAAELEERLLATREALLDHVERTGTEEDRTASKMIGIHSMLADLMDIGTKPFLAFVDEATLKAMRLFLMLVVQTHPEGQSLLHRAIDLAPEPWSPDEAIQDISGLLVEVYPELRQEELVARAREGLARAAAAAGAGVGGGSPEGQSWSRVCEAVFRSLGEEGGPLDEAVGSSIAFTARASSRLEAVPEEAAPPDERLGKICQRLGLEVYRRLERPKGRVEH